MVRWERGEGGSSTDTQGATLLLFSRRLDFMLVQLAAPRTREGESSTTHKVRGKKQHHPKERGEAATTPGEEGKDDNHFALMKPFFTSLQCGSNVNYHPAENDYSCK